MSKIPTLVGLLTLMFFLIVVYLLLDTYNKKKEPLSMRQNNIRNIPNKMYNSSKRNLRNKYKEIKKYVL